MRLKWNRINHHATRRVEGGSPETATRKQLTLNTWCAKKFPEIHAQYGNPIALKQNRDGDLAVDDFSEDFFAALLGEHGFPAMPSVFVRDENRFYRFDPPDGYYREQTEASLMFRLSRVFRECCEKLRRPGRCDETRVSVPKKRRARWRYQTGQGHPGGPEHIF